MEQQNSSQPRLARWSLIIGIVIVLNMFFNYAISLVYKEPRYEDYVTPPNVSIMLQTREQCVNVGGQWNEQVVSAPVKGIESVSGYCDPDYTKRQEYEAAHAKYQRTVFLILVVLGIASLMVGISIGIPIVTPALAWGGVLSLLIASLRYWSAADNIIKVLILALALAGLIWIAIKKFSK